MENTITSAGTSGYYGSCKYRLPCGYCELKKENCNSWSTISVPINDYQKFRITSTWNSDQNGVINATCNDK